ncbi:hypothetical protein [Paractinoplanes atraurantiacus]|uniref:Uncharacterized protein n=1 Tax=Paractinoplanes atraurantiacus TaxID=1036182 RepID=A0A285FEL5_9ACTN|nr:hypothetical protein [Actinoplanes atraurantiacus]SNY09745.1 hypothetical protein SAMN05421748_101898 [Actinoplanes atraurantiacus]
MSKNTVKPVLTRNRRRRRNRRGRARVWVTFLVRFLTGRPLDGRRYSNATFWAKATRRVGVPSYLVTWRWWAMAAGWQKAGIRLTLVAAALLILAEVVTR